MATYCADCGGKIMLNKSNWVRTPDGIYVHKKCPSSKNKMTEEESIAYKALTDRVIYHFNNNANSFIKDKGVNFPYLTKRIKELKTQGYCYQDQLYALDRIVDIQGGFGGYGHVINNISRIITERDKQEQIKAEFKNDIKNKPEEVKFSFDLGSETDFEW